MKHLLRRHKRKGLGLIALAILAGEAALSSGVPMPFVDSFPWWVRVGLFASFSIGAILVKDGSGDE